MLLTLALILNFPATFLGHCAKSDGTYLGFFRNQSNLRGLGESRARTFLASWVTLTYDSSIVFHYSN